MEYKEYVAAVDLGTTKIVIAIGSRAEKNKVEIIAIKEIPSQGILRGDVRNGEQASQAIKEVKTMIETELGIVINEVYIGISGQHIRCTKATGYVFVQNSDQEVSEVKEVDVRRLRDDMKNSSIPLGQSIIAVLPQSYTLDDEPDITEPVGMEGRRLEARFNLIVGEDAAIDRIRRTFMKAGLKVAGIILQPLASSEAVLSEDEKELGVAVVDIGGGTSDICIYYDKIIRHIAVIPIGGSIVNKDIKAYGILERYVEKLKITFGEAIKEKAQAEKYINIPSVSGQAPKEISVRSLAGIIQARMEDIIEYIDAEIDRAGLKGKLGAGIVLTGGSSVLKNLPQLCKSKLGYDVRVVSPHANLTEQSLEKVADPRYSTIAGLLIDAVRSGRYTDMEILDRPIPQPEPEPQPAAKPKQPGASQSANSATNGSQPTRPYFEPQYTDQAKPSQKAASAEQYQEDNYDESENYDEPQDDYSDDDQTYFDDEITTTTKGGGFFDKMKKMFSGIFVEEVDDENY